MDILGYESKPGLWKQLLVATVLVVVCPLLAGQTGCGEGILQVHWPAMNEEAPDGNDDVAPEPDPDPDPDPELPEPVEDDGIVQDNEYEEPPVDDPDSELPDDDDFPIEQSGYSVEDAMLEQCTTGAVQGLSLQLIDQMNCLEPGIMKSFAGHSGIGYSAVVFPFQQGPATDTLFDIVDSGGTLSVSSALRTLPQQYLLYQWYQRGMCNANLAARPGRSNHNGGLAVDIRESDSWRSAFRDHQYIDDVPGEPWHFYYSQQDGRDVRNLSVLAFQQLWNRNYPDEVIDEDGLYGPQTEGALKASPASGFALGASCAHVTGLVAYPFGVPVELQVAEGYDASDEWIDVRVIVPGGIEFVEFVVGDELIQTTDELRISTFHATLPADRDIRVIAYDARGEKRGESLLVQRPSFRALPLGHHNYRFQGAIEANAIRGQFVLPVPSSTDILVTHPEFSEMEQMR